MGSEVLMAQITSCGLDKRYHYYSVYGDNFFCNIIVMGNDCFIMPDNGHNASNNCWPAKNNPNKK